MQTIRVQETLVEKQCGSCGIWFAVPDWFEKEAERLGPQGGWHCPNGHQRHYTHGQKEKDELVRLRDAVRAKEAQLQHERDQKEATERQLAAQKGANTKLKKRIGKGVCPHCQRHFENVERHMVSKHPECVTT